MLSSHLVYSIVPSIVTIPLLPEFNGIFNQSSLFNHNAVCFQCVGDSDECVDKIFSMYELAKITTPEIKPMTLEDYSGPHVTINMTLDSINWKKYKISKF